MQFLARFLAPILNRPLAKFVTYALDLGLGILIGIFLEEKMYYWIALPGVVSVFLYVLRYRAHEYQDRSRVYLTTFELLLLALYETCHFDHSHGVRCTFLEPMNQRNGNIRLLQVARYSFDGTRISSTSMSTNQGIAGRCYRTNKQQYEQKIDGNLVQHLIDNWGFSRDEAVSFRQDRRCYLCTPIVYKSNNPTSNDRVLGIIALDAALERAFSSQVCTEVFRFTQYFNSLIADRELHTL